MSHTQHTDRKPVVAISHGDINSISYEVILKALCDQRIVELFTPVVYGLSKIFSFHRKTITIPDFQHHTCKRAEPFNVKQVNLVNLSDRDYKVDLGQSTETAGELAVLSINAVLEDLQKGIADVMVTAPINKENVKLALKKPFSGHTEYLAEKMGVSDYLMLMVHNNLRVGVVTGHIPLAEVPKKIHEPLVLRKLSILEQSLQQDFAIRKPKIAVLGLNPHAGDGGLIGNEDETILKPAIEKAQKSGMLVFGPYAADGFFASGQHNHFDGILAMYHDQGLLPFKILALGAGVNFTAGLPFVRTSPAHGTAYDIAGKDLASADSMREAMYVACEIFQNRKLWKELKQNPLPLGRYEKDTER